MKGFLHNTWKNRNHVLMALPVFLVLFFIMYVPMGGLILAFKKFDYQAGIFGSPWVGLENFKMLIASKSKFYSITRNTVLYYLLFTAVGTLLNVTLAIALDRLFFKKLAKTISFSCSQANTLIMFPVVVVWSLSQL